MIPPVLAGLAGGTSVRVIVAGLALVGAGLCGASLMADHKDAQIARLQRSYAEQAERAAVKARADLQTAVQRGEALSARITAEEATRQTQTEEKTHVIRRVTTGRPCLGSAAVRLLNEPAGLKPIALSAPASQPAGADAAFATDTDVGLWANNARRQYDTCRGRLGAVADFYPEEAAE